MKPNLKQFTTTELIHELTSRPEVELGCKGVLQTIDVLRKYCDDKSVLHAVVMIVPYERIGEPNGK